ncbi:MAG: DegT/DnrJ/EryC1/StrS family aminotransferase [Thermodesulfobacteriota bacterium]|nr:DegT/DnrJ/EryC1/StrS family aminotransferase [Thermodesulfobacteriota bacterium]
MQKTIPFVDLQAEYDKLRLEVSEAISAVLNTTAFVLGPAVERFESEFAAYCETRYAIACNSGTSALHLALRACDIQPGDEVITVSHTFIATAWAISYCCATPVFVDVDPNTRTMDVSHIESKITSRTKAVIPVHLYGHPADMEPIISIAKERGLAVIEDAAQAHGARYRGMRVGCMGDVGCFSFYPSKNLGAYGEAGAVVTNDEAIARKVRLLRDHGQSKRYQHDVLGYNYRMDGLQGAILGVKLLHLDEWNEKRRKIARKYNEFLKEIREMVLPTVAPWAEPVFHLYVIEYPERSRLRRALNEMGISTGLHYPIPIHLQKPYGYLNLGEGALPVTEKLAKRCLSLPMYPEMTDEMVKDVCEVLRRETNNR